MLRAYLLQDKHARHMVTVGNVNIVIYEKIVLVLHPHVDVRTVWYVRHSLEFGLDDQFCLRDSKNVAFV